MASIFIVILLSTLANGLVFKCTFEIQDWTSVGRLYTCSQTVILGYEVRKSLESVVGVHTASNENYDVEALIISDQVLLEIPPNVNSFFPNLKAILIYNTNLRTISSDDLPFPNLEYFASMLNKLQAIDGELFMNTPKLTTVSFYKNSLEHVGENIFKGLNDLAYVNFQENTCVDAGAWTALGIRQLTEKLQNDCQCVYRCSLGNEVEELEVISDEFSKTIKELTEKNSKQDQVIDDLRKISQFNQDKLKELDDILRSLDVVECETNEAKLTSTLKIISIAFVSLFSITIFLVVVAILYRKCIVKTDKPSTGNVHKFVISQT